MNPVVLKLREELAQAEADLRLLSQRYTPDHEGYKAQQARIDALKLRISTEGTNYSRSRPNDIHHDLLKKRSEAAYMLATSQARLSSINASLAQAHGRANSLSVAEPKLMELLLERVQTENRYRVLSDRLAQAIIDENAFDKNGSIALRDPAQGTGRGEVIGPTRLALVIYGLVLSLIFGVAVAIWFDSIDTRMRNAADVEQLLSLPALGLIRQLTGRDGVLPKLTHLYPLSDMAESYRILRTNVLFALRDHPFKTLMVATGRPGQGGTTTICNLAIALAQIGKRIILIDADMRRPSLHKFFGVSNETGLSTVLQGRCKLTDAFRKTDIDNLVVIPGGPQPMNPSELLGSDQMREMVRMLEEHCDLVLFDTPSTIVFSDGPMLASWIDAVIMVVSANQKPRGTETVTRDLLRRANANILGVVVNRMRKEAVDSCYYYEHYYSDSVPRPKAIPAPAAAEAKAADDHDNPFPD
jgi:capsular exopolysaccharide synthesis family protein